MIKGIFGYISPVCRTMYVCACICMTGTAWGVKVWDGCKKVQSGTYSGRHFCESPKGFTPIDKSDHEYAYIYLRGNDGIDELTESDMGSEDIVRKEWTCATYEWKMPFYTSPTAHVASCNLFEKDSIRQLDDEAFQVTFINEDNEPTTTFAKVYKFNLSRVEMCKPSKVWGEDNTENKTWKTNVSIYECGENFITDCFNHGIAAKPGADITGGPLKYGVTSATPLKRYGRYVRCAGYTKELYNYYCPEKSWLKCHPCPAGAYRNASSNNQVCAKCSTAGYTTDGKGGPCEKCSNNNGGVKSWKDRIYEDGWNTTKGPGFREGAGPCQIKECNNGYYLKENYCDECPKPGVDEYTDGGEYTVHSKNGGVNGIADCYLKRSGQETGFTFCDAIGCAEVTGPCKTSE